MKLNGLPLILSLAVLAICCNDPDKQEPFFIYQVSGEEGNDDITIHLRFRTGGRDAKTILLPAPARVELDGEEIHPDSTEFTGVYYEVQKRIDSFIGKHQIVYTDKTGKKYTEEFEFVPLRLTTDLPDTLQKSDLEFQFTGLLPSDKLRVLLIDTAFHTNDINELMTVSDGKLRISRELLDENIAGGPIYLEFHKELERPVREATARGGRLVINYGLKRQVVME